MVRILFHNVETVDCTSDPHPVNFNGLNEMLDTILKVCEDGIVWAVRSVVLEGVEKIEVEYDGDIEMENITYESDRYNETDYDKKYKLAKGEMAKKHKVAGLYMTDDAHTYKNGKRIPMPANRHLPPGLSGLKEAIKLIKKNPMKFSRLNVGVSWDFVRDSSCSDYITAELDTHEVDFSNQDWWTEKEDYPAHIARLSELVGVYIEPTSS